MFHLICSYRYYTVMISPITDILYIKVKSTLGSNQYFGELDCIVMECAECMILTSLLQKGPVSGLYSSNLIVETQCVTLISLCLLDELSVPSMIIQNIDVFPQFIYYAHSVVIQAISKGCLISSFLSVTFKVNSKAAESLADPAEYPNLFEDWQIALSVESTLAPKRYLFAIMGYKGIKLK